MSKAKKLFLLRERHETWRVRFNQTRRVTVCDACHRKVDWLTINEASKLSSLSEREVFWLVETGRVHFAESEGGKLMVCGLSLSARTLNQNVKGISLVIKKEKRR